MSDLNILCYKDYYTRIEFSAPDKILYGRLLGITDFVDFMSESAEGIIKEFHSAVDDYIEFCRELGKEPEKPSSLPLTDDYNDSQTKIAV
ncbi:MAG: type II toxin-antitoxin system HicB family antitoxin [Synergistaceae bacterium]|nr:type II toxin-antitoxin system HicB family antitoxin [Synergistaceae bacterium]